MCASVRASVRTPIYGASESLDNIEFCSIYCSQKKLIKTRGLYCVNEVCECEPVWVETG